MAEITASLVKELRDRTGAGMMECKKALVEANGDIELAIDNMRKSGQAKAAKKAGRVAAEGVIIARVANGFGVLVEMNCETDFVAKDAGFLGLANEVADYAVANKGISIEDLAKHFEEKRAALVAKIGENMTIRRVQFLDNVKASYLHGAKIGVLVASGCGAECACDEDIFKKVAMHVAASRPDFVNPEDVPAAVVAHEREIQVDIAMQSGKPREIAEKMVEGRMKKFTGEVSLTGQPFVMDPSQTVGDFLKANKTSVSGFIRFEVGEGIEKKEEDFAAEVAKITGGNA
ncbi:translation elongation factor Ts [Lonepinella sp. BR2474]|uniref:translation elongation factor Ts n=1 Tax=Lonepinella sp. BR2474 TaxID=3434548 RepID=UPI003F6E4100